MPAGQFTPGPIHHFAQFRGESTARYLGTAVIAPDQEAEDFKIPVLNDLGGRSVPFQLIQDGEQWMIMTTLNRFDIQVARGLRALPNGGPGQNRIIGQETDRARGTLVLGVSDFQLVLVNGYAGTPSAGVYPLELNQARGFYSSTILKYKESTAGTRVLEISMAIQCNNLFVPATGGFICYTESGPFSLYGLS